MVVDNDGRERNDHILCGSDRVVVGQERTECNGRVLRLERVKHRERIVAGLAAAGAPEVYQDRVGVLENFTVEIGVVELLHGYVGVRALSG